MRESTKGTLNDRGKEISVDTIASGDCFLISTRMLIGSIGTVACFSWIFLSIGSDAYASPGLIDALGSGMYHLLFVCGLLCSLLLSWAVSGRISRAPFSTASFVLSAIGCGLIWLPQVPLAVLSIGCILFGFGQGLLYPLYGELFSWLYFNNLKRHVAGIFISAILCSLVAVLLGFPLGNVVALLFPIVAFACYIAELPYFKASTVSVSVEESDARCRVKMRSYLATTTAGLVVGFSLGGVAFSDPFPSNLAEIVAAVAALAASIVLFRDSTGKNRLTESVSMRMFLPYSAVVAFPMIFVPAEWRILFLVLLLCGSLLPITCSLGAICSHISLFGLHAVRTFSFGRFWSVLGVLFGWIIATIGMADGLLLGFDQTLRIAICVVTFMILVIFSASFVMTRDNYPTKLDVEKSAEDPSGTPLFEFSDNGSREEDGVAAQGKERPGKFYLQCEVVSREYGLSARQREVLGMLARGRNAEYITEKLIISSHTAKAHIYNIYQKTGVHSRQELMDLVENADVSDDNPIVQEIYAELAVK